MQKIKLDHFEPKEFRRWRYCMNSELLYKLDYFRELWGAPVIISPAEGAIGREDNSNSQHNFLKWDEVRAIDVLPEGMTSDENMRKAVQIAKDVGFTGIGLYPDWEPSPGLHLDVRSGRVAGRPAMWSGLMVDGKQRYSLIEEAYS